MNNGYDQMEVSEHLPSVSDIEHSLSQTYPDAPPWAIGLNGSISAKIDIMNLRLARVETKCDVGQDSIAAVKRSLKIIVNILTY